MPRNSIGGLYQKARFPTCKKCGYVHRQGEKKCPKKYRKRGYHIASVQSISDLEKSLARRFNA